MSLLINQNNASMNAARNLSMNDTQLSSSIQRLSTGYKINNASDDPAGLVRSEKMRAQVSGLGQAISNSQDAVNMVKTAEGALTQTNSLLGSMRDLAVHAANSGANDTDSIAADQAQIKSAIESLNRISSTTAFGGQKLLDGSASFTASISDTAHISSISAVAGSSSAFAAGGAVTVNVTTAATQTSGISTAAMTSDKAAATGTLTINGVSIGNYTSGSTDSSTIAADINAKTTQTGVTASYDTGTHKMTLTQQTYGATNNITLGGTGGAATLGGVTNTQGVDAAATVTVNGVTQDFSKGSGETLKSASGDTIVLAAGTAAANLNQVGTLAGNALSFQVGANAGETASVSIGSTAANQLGTGVAGSSFSDVSKIDVTTNAADAIKVIDKAIAQVSNQRASLGSFQKNVLESNISSLGVTKENVSASEAAIRDTDMATEMSNYTRLNILEQAGTSMLAQANQQPQQLLSLLR